MIKIVYQNESYVVWFFKILFNKKKNGLLHAANTLF